MHWRDQIAELFPTVDADSFYKPRHTDPFGSAVPVGSCLYNYYKIYRRLQFKAGHLKAPDSSGTAEAEASGSSDDSGIYLQHFYSLI